MANLYTLHAEVRNILAAVEDGGGELTDELLARIDAITGSIESTLDAYGALVREAESRVAARQAEIDRLAAANKTDANAARRFREHLLAVMTLAGTRKIRTALFQAWIQASPPSATCTVDPEQLPPEFRRVRIEADRTAALAHWKDTGQAPEGFEILQSEHLRLK